jgi:chromosome segregation ATPase
MTDHVLAPGEDITVRAARPIGIGDFKRDVKLRELQEWNDNQAEQIFRLRERLEAREVELRGTTNDLLEAEQDVDKLMKENDDLAQDNKMLREANEAWMKRAYADVARKHKDDAELTALQDALLATEQDVEMYAEANQELIEELNRAKAAAKLSDDVARKLNGTTNELDSQVYQLKREVERLEKQRNTLANNYDGHLASCKTVFEKLDSFERQAAAAGKRGVEWMRRHDEVKVENESLRVQLSTCKANWRAKNDEAVRLSAALQAADQNYADLQRMVGEAMRVSEAPF